MKPLKEHIRLEQIKQYWKKYLRPKHWELTARNTIYDMIGIRFFKKYLPTTGDIVRRWRNQVSVHIGKKELQYQLYNAELQTRRYEFRHILGMLGFIIIAGAIDKKLTFSDYIFLICLNLFVNVYPIFLQRYNRIRIIKILQKKGLKSPFQ